MLKLIKKYFLNIFNLSFLLYLIFIFIILFNNPDYGIYFIIIEILFVIGIFIEIIYYIVHAIKHKEINNNYLLAVLIYLFNIFYIPCYRMKYIIKDKNHKKINIIYIITSILLYVLILATIVLLSIGSSSDKGLKYTKYITEDNFIRIKLPNDFQRQDPANFDYFFQNEDTSIGIFIYDHTGYTDKELLTFQINDMKTKRENMTKIDSYTENDKNKHYSVETYKGKYNNEYYIYKFATMNFDENKDYIMSFIIVTPEKSYSKNEKQISKIFEMININD